MPIDARTAAKVLAESDQLVSPEQVRAALEELAAGIGDRLRDSDPLVLSVMTGGLIFTGQLLPLLDFPLQLDYIHASRYRGETRGGETLHWIARPTLPVADRNVLVLDDILDEGLTLAAIVDWLKQAGARSVTTAVLVRKRHDRCLEGIEADFVGLELEDRYLFGCGMDYHNYHRNLPGIHAVGGDD